MEENLMQFGAMPTNPLIDRHFGTSGIGKDAVVGLLRKSNENTHFVITMNSRAPRSDEVDGRDYFVTREEFEQKLPMTS